MLRERIFVQCLRKTAHVSRGPEEHKTLPRQAVQPNLKLQDSTVFHALLAR